MTEEVKKLNRVYLSLGSNIEPEANLPKAVELLAKSGTVRAVSKVYESTADGAANQKNYLNAAVLFETEAEATDLKRWTLAGIERTLKREKDKQNRFAPRTIDIDISLYNQEFVELGRREIPDPAVLTKPYVAAPLADLDPTYRHPLTGEKLSAIATRLLEKSPLRIREDIQLQCPPLS